MDAERFDALARMVASRANRRQILGGLLAGYLARLGLGTASAQGSPAACASQDQLTQEDAERLLDDAGITWTSSGNCSDRTNGRCTSFEDIRRGTIDGTIAFREASGCDVVITGGTETGHAGGDLSHENGYKIDFRLSDCIDEYIEDNYEEIEPRRNGDRQWQSPDGATFAREGNHWDITFPPAPGTGETLCGDGCCGACQRCEEDACVPLPNCPADSACGECGPCEACQATATRLPSAQFEMACRSTCGPGQTCNEDTGRCEDEGADPCAPSQTGIGQCR